jgi:hypothetical protein
MFISFLHPTITQFSAGFYSEIQTHQTRSDSEDLWPDCSKLLTSAIQVSVCCVTAVATSNC